MKKNSLFGDVKVTINPDIKIHPNPFPRKMAMAIEFIEKHGLPKEMKKKKKAKKPQLTTLQKELLDFYAQEPTEQQMHQVKAFLAQMFQEGSFTTEMLLESKIAA
jgi:hypothetical protein